VTIIRPHHPLGGEKLSVLQEGNTRLVLAHPRGGGLRIARGWTDADGIAAPVQLARASVQSETAGLRDLMQLVESLKRRSCASED